MLKSLDLATPTVILCVIILAWGYYHSCTQSIPGPLGYIIIWNLFNWPSEYQTEHMAEWQKLYGVWKWLLWPSRCINDIAGPVTKLSVLGKMVLFLTLPCAISELFAKGSSTFSDHPHSVFSEELYILFIMQSTLIAYEVASCSMHVLHLMTQFKEDFCQQRKFMKEVLGGDVIYKHKALLDDECKHLFQGILQALKECDQLFQRFALSNKSTNT